jgi:hypothetical protein
MSSKIAIETVSITTVGGAGVAVGSGSTIPIHGYLLDVYLDYHTSCPATSDVTITDPVFGVICVKSNNSTDCHLAPRLATHDASAAATGMYDYVPLNGSLSISVAQADALTNCLVATVRWLTL